MKRAEYRKHHLYFYIFVDNLLWVQRILFHSLWKMKNTNTITISRSEIWKLLYVMNFSSRAVQRLSSHVRAISQTTKDSVNHSLHICTPELSPVDVPRCWAKPIHVSVPAGLCRCAQVQRRSCPPVPRLEHVGGQAQEDPGSLCKLKFCN